MSCNCGSVVKDERFEKIDEVLARNGRDESMLIQNLEQIQHELGYLPEDVQSCPTPAQSRVKAREKK